MESRQERTKKKELFKDPTRLSQRRISPQLITANIKSKERILRDAKEDLKSATKTVTSE